MLSASFNGMAWTIEEATGFYSKYGLAASFYIGFRYLMSALKKKIISFGPIDNICYRISKGRIRDWKAEERDLTDVLFTAVSYRGVGNYSSIEPQQIRSELKQAAERAKETDPSVVMEIGTADGGTLYTWSRYLNPDVIISVDLPGGIHGGGYPAEREKFYREFTDADLYLYRADSHSEKTRDIVEEQLAGDSIDFLFIDGDHRYEGVKRDFELYKSLVREGGIIALHDIVENPNQDSVSVHQYWEELCEQYEVETIIADPDYQDWAGIGLVTKS